VVGFDPIAAAIRLGQKDPIIQSGTADRFSREEIAESIDMLDFTRRAAVDVEVTDELAASRRSRRYLLRRPGSLFNRTASHTSNQRIGGE
jgi:hypothetical protein